MRRVGAQEAKDELTLRKTYKARRQRVCHMHYCSLCTRINPNSILFPQKFCNRMSVKPSEMVHWKQLTLEFMTKESDHPDNSSLIVEHNLQWR